MRIEGNKLNCLKTNKTKGISHEHQNRIYEIKTVKFTVKYPNSKVPR